MKTYIFKKLLMAIVDEYHDTNMGLESDELIKVIDEVFKEDPDFSDHEPSEWYGAAANAFNELAHSLGTMCDEKDIDHDVW